MEHKETDVIFVEVKEEPLDDIDTTDPIQENYQQVAKLLCLCRMVLGRYPSNLEFDVFVL